MKLTFECPSCGAANDADEDSGGLSRQCIACHGTLIVPTTVARANVIFDRIIEIQTGGGFLQPVSLSKVGAASVAESMASLYLVTAQTFHTAMLHDNPTNQRILRDFSQAAGGTGMWIALSFRPDGTPQPQSVDDIKVDESLKDSETIDSFLTFLRSLDPASSSFWRLIYSRIGIPYPEAMSGDDRVEKQRAHWWQRLFR